MFISPEFRMGQYRDDNHREDAPRFMRTYILYFDFDWYFLSCARIIDRYLGQQYFRMQDRRNLHHSYILDIELVGIYSPYGD